MCFTPIVSLSTAIIEWVLAVILLSFVRKSKLTYYFSAILVLLGTYQFTEYMLCTSLNPIWVKLGFIAYSFLPVLGLHASLSYLNKKRNIFLLYLIPAAYSIFALFSQNFVIAGKCLRLFVEAKTLLTNNPVLYLPYGIYYVSFIVVSLVLMARAYYAVKNNTQKKVHLLIMLGILCMALPTFIVIQLFPLFHFAFPSVLCHFALLLAILFFLAVYFDSKVVATRNKDR